jgi:hypothetical protein
MSKTAKERLNEVLASYGADPRRWPPEDRQLPEGLMNAEDAEVREALVLDALLATAREPAIPLGAQNRLMQKLQHVPREGNVVAIRRPRAAPAWNFRWLAAVPLAASLALGIYLGAAGSLDSVLPVSVVGTVTAAGDDPGDLSGVSDVEALSEDSVS